MKSLLKSVSSVKSVVAFRRWWRVAASVWLRKLNRRRSCWPRLRQRSANAANARRCCRLVSLARKRRAAARPAANAGQRRSVKREKETQPIPAVCVTETLRKA